MKINEFKEKVIFYKNNNDKKLFDAIFQRVKKHFPKELAKEKIKKYDLNHLSKFLRKIISRKNAESQLLINIFSIDNDIIYREANELGLAYEYCFSLHEKAINHDLGNLVYTGIPRKDCKRIYSWFHGKLIQHERQVTEYFHMLIRDADQKEIASAHTVASKKKQNETNKNYLKNKIIKTEDKHGNLTSRSLSTISKKPENIFIKHKIKILGLFDFAEKSMLTGYLITATLPAEYHPNSEKWSGNTPKQGHEQLKSTWRNFQKRIYKVKIKLFGVRVQEAHRDGCPHWHILIFVDILNSQNIKTLITESFKKTTLWIQDIDVDKNKISNYLLKDLNPNDKSKRNIDFNRFEINDAYRATWIKRTIQFFDVPGSNSIWDILRSLKGSDNLSKDAQDLHRFAISNKYGDFLYLLQAMNNNTQKRVKIIYSSSKKYPIGLSIDNQDIFIKH